MVADLFRALGFVLFLASRPIQSLTERSFNIHACSKLSASLAIGITLSESAAVRARMYFDAGFRSVDLAALAVERFKRVHRSEIVIVLR